VQITRFSFQLEGVTHCEGPFFAALRLNPLRYIKIKPVHLQHQPQDIPSIASLTIMATPSPPAYARPFHTIRTPRLLIRSGIPSDALAVKTLRGDPRNSPFGGVVEADLPVSVQRQRLENQAASTAAGKNAWTVVILTNPSAADPSVEELRVDEGVMIGNTGFNCFPLQPSLADPATQVVVGDTGVLVDYRFARKGYALEALSAVVEYGFV
jgi:RimJ/RimL family protein N-acetyltransferase